MTDNNSNTNIIETKVVNVRVKNIRPRYNNLNDWCNDQNNVYIGRKGVLILDKKRYPEKDSIWANPYKINKNNDRADVINKYEIYIREKLEDDYYKEELLKLRGKNLGCWCKPESCHGDVLIKLIEELIKELIVNETIFNLENAEI